MKPPGQRERTVIAFNILDSAADQIVVAAAIMDGGAITKRTDELQRLAGRARSVANALRGDVPAEEIDAFLDGMLREADDEEEAPGVSDAS